MKKIKTDINTVYGINNVTALIESNKTHEIIKIFINFNVL